MGSKKKLTTDVDLPKEEVGKQKPKTGFKDRLTSLFSLPKKEEDIPPPGTPPTFNDDGSIADPGNPYIGPIDPKLGYAPEGYSGEQLRRIRRAQKRRQAAERRVGERAYNREQKALRRGQALVNQRQRVLDGEIEISPALYENILREAQRIVSLPDVKEYKDRRARQAQAREDRLADRREARFRAGKPRGKDLREDVYNEYESLLPESARNRRA